MSSAACSARTNLHAELGQIVAGARSGREREDERILFWHRGLATTDLAVGQLLYERAVERRSGHPAALPLTR